MTTHGPLNPIIHNGGSWPPPPAPVTVFPQITVPAPRVTREEVWLRAYVARASHPNTLHTWAVSWADLALKEFDKRFPST